MRLVASPAASHLICTCDPPLAPFGRCVLGKQVQEQPQGVQQDCSGTDSQVCMGINSPVSGAEYLSHNFETCASEGW